MTTISGASLLDTRMSFGVAEVSDTQIDEWACKRPTICLIERPKPLVIFS